MLYRQLGQILTDCGLLTEHQLRAAEAVRNQTGQDLPEILFSQGYTTPAEVSAALEARFCIGFCDLDTELLSEDAASLLPRPLAQKHRMVPIRTEGNALLLAMANPLDLQAAVRMLEVSQPMTTAISSMPSRCAVADRQYPAPEVKPVFSPVAPG